MKNCYEILEIEETASESEIRTAKRIKIGEIREALINGVMGKEEADKAIKIVSDAADEAIGKIVVSDKGHDGMEHGTGATSPFEEDDDDLALVTGADVARETESEVGRRFNWKKAVAITLVGAVIISGIVAAYLNRDKLFKKGDMGNTVNPPVSSSEVKPGDTTQGGTTQNDEDPKKDNTEAKPETQVPDVVHYADINDEKVVEENAKALVQQLIDLGVINPTTGSRYTVEEIVRLIKYANGIYTPQNMEEIDLLHMDLLNLLISPLNTDPYLYHVVFASGNDDFKDIAIEAVKDIKPIDFAKAFCEYGTNGVYPLTQWMQQKREEIFTATDREKINAIYIEVGQVMADIMKGNGCTITVKENGKDVTYKYTSEQILANHASAMLLTIDAQLIFANHYEIRDNNDKVIEAVQTEWKVYNKFNGEDPDIVTLDEIQAWINNGCDYEWGIDSVLIGGQTFGQRIQGNLEGMAQNNLAMSQGTTAVKQRSTYSPVAASTLMSITDAGDMEGVRVYTDGSEIVVVYDEDEEKADIVDVVRQQTTRKNAYLRQTSGYRQPNINQRALIRTYARRV